MKNRAEGYFFEDSQQDSEQSDDASSLKRKKIKKKHTKKKSRAIAKAKPDQSSPIELFFNKNKDLFTCSKELVKEMYRQTIVSNCHVRQLISKTEGTVFDIKQADSQQDVSKYIALLRAIKLSNYQKVGISGRHGSLAVGMLRKKMNPAKPAHARETRFLTFAQDLLIIKRAMLREQVKTYVQQTSSQMGYSQIQITEPEIEILTLTKINCQMEQELMGKICSALARENKLGSYHFREEDSELQNQYMRALIIKNLERGCSQKRISPLNYHKGIEAYENNSFMETDFTPILDMVTFKRYMGWKKPKHNKSSRHVIRTPCSACLSDFSELTNPIVKCPQCPIRVHIHCQKMATRCHRCRFGRTSTEQKKKTGFCYICNRQREKGLMILTVTNKNPHYFAHNFCLLVHNLWRVEEGEFKGQHVTTPQNNSPCTICSQRNGLMINCINCGQSAHAMCSYLAGSSFKMAKTPQEPTPYRMEVSCCQESSLRWRLSNERKFKLNFQKVIFRQDKEIFEYIGNCMMREQQEGENMLDKQ